MNAKDLYNLARNREQEVKMESCKLDLEKIQRGLDEAARSGNTSFKFNYTNSLGCCNSLLDLTKKIYEPRGYKVYDESTCEYDPQSEEFLVVDFSQKEKSWWWIFSKR